MKKLLFVGVLACLGCLSACGSAPTKPGPSEYNYRETLTLIKLNVETNTLPAWRALKVEDRMSSSPRHSIEWWDAKIALEANTAILASDVLALGAAPVTS